ncbi:16137_t:CDS:10 [Dentiscutata erythropus]|uniref:Midasin n=1 Tax=Dentiscutata erythropus TaxID=1348616 RepID=A0A9N8VBQ0_9GLOM|nr:16137_t:CDS:10 [Dentiscutata erythropus]
MPLHAESALPSFNSMELDVFEKSSFETELFDPLEIDIYTACKGLLLKIERIRQSNQFDVLENFCNFLNAFLINEDCHDSVIKPLSTRELLNCLSDLLLHPLLTLPIAELFRPILLDLVSRWLLPRETMQISTFDKFEVYSRIDNVAFAFSQLLPIAPQLLRQVLNLAVTLFSRSPSIFSGLDSLNQNECNKDKYMTEKDIQSLLITAYRLLRFSTTTFSRLWDWSTLTQLLTHPNKAIRYLTLCCLGIVFGMSDEQKERAHSIWVGPKIDPILIDWENGETLDVRMLTILDQVIHYKQQFNLLQNDYGSSLTGSHILQDNDLSPLTVKISKVLLQRLNPSINTISKVKQRLVMTDTTQRNLNAICLALSMGSPILLEGVTGSGKTSLIEEIAIATGRDEGDQTDAKVLLGTYVSTSTPAAFRWQPGILTTAVRDGYWVLIEDIDLASIDVLSILFPLLETGQLFIPDKGEKILAKQGFQLFATRNLLSNCDGEISKRQMTDSDISNTLWTKINVQSQSIDELEFIIANRYEGLRTLVPDIMRVYKTIISIYQDVKMFSSNALKFISARDLMKWCKRIEFFFSSNDLMIGSQGLSSRVREELFKEAVDCFCAMISDHESLIVVLERLGETLGLTDQWVRHFVNSYTPNINIDEKGIIIGRAQFVSMNRKKYTNIKRESQKQRFANTGHALKLLEQIAVCVLLCEPVLLVGETGTGKTATIQYLAELMHQNLIVVNLSQQGDSSDLLGGFKPVDVKAIVAPLKEEFNKLFGKTFSVKKNSRFLETVHKMYVTKKYFKLITLMQEAIKLAGKSFDTEQSQDERKNSRKVSNPELRNQWKLFDNSVKEFQQQYDQIRNNFVFKFVEGSLANAVTNGDWILLDEINLASTETLECLNGILQDPESSLLLIEKGDSKPIIRHPNFRIFACMNPATDVGKRDLPPGLRSRFSEFYVSSPDSRRDDLLCIVKKYLSGCIHGEERACVEIVDFYLEVKELQRQHKLVDGSNQRPHFSMRTLTRALSVVSQITAIYGLRRSIYEGFCMTFLTQLNKESEIIMQGLFEKYLLNGVNNPKALTTQIPRQPPNGDYVQFGCYWLKIGHYPPKEVSHYILTPSVIKNLNNLARVVMSSKFPVLLQGPTSAGKTSMIHYLAQRTNHRFMRINNHEHTDLQEYLGSYVTNSEGKLEYQEGALVEAVRKGYWLVLDELNLAPTDVLEALNRLLDDNRELFIPETQEMIKPHSDFMLFATQNPSGLYAGRKALSRAFRNRFVEIHFNDIPEEELETIISEKCSIAPSHCKRMVQVYKRLMEQRQSTRIFERQHGFITLRDLFRWAKRGAIDYKELAEQGFMLLAERVRKPDEKLIVKQVLETVMKVTIDENSIYDCSRLEEFKMYRQNNIVWTKAMKRLFMLVAQCLRFNEPVLLIGETGCGKTSVCQVLAEARHTGLYILNCHHSTETADLLGGQRPLRNRDILNSELKHDISEYLKSYEEHDIDLENIDLCSLVRRLDLVCKDEQSLHIDKDKAKHLSSRYKQSCSTLFEWNDGPLVKAMKSGSFFLLDEISLADDSVIERLNSVLEPHRSLTLPEKGGKCVEELVAKEGFQFLATMNPGGDYGKKELSPALRNRFTEIWVPPISNEEDLLQVISAQLVNPSKNVGSSILEFINWFSHMYGNQGTIISLRDIISWVNFINVTIERLGPKESFIHGGCLVFLDGLGSSSASRTILSEQALKDIRMKCLTKLKELSAHFSGFESIDNFDDCESIRISSTETHFGIHHFSIPKGPYISHDIAFTLQAPTTSDNAMSILRAMQVRKPILLEGSPGAGKTSLITALAAVSGQRLVRINLSDQTDLIDLFGSDLPVEGGRSGEFAWRDAPFLQAMKSGDWVLLDELNLASQSVLEGLNSCLDHREAIYVPELDKEFFCAQGFRVFGAQNPLYQGGGRKGLPRSFINRFTQVYIEQLTNNDLLFICKSLFPRIKDSILKKIIEFNTRINEDIMIKCLYGRSGAPWEFNLRDVLRWLELLSKDYSLGFYSSPAEYLDLIYLQRMRNKQDRDCIISVFNEIFGLNYQQQKHPYYHIDPKFIQVGHSLLEREDSNISHSLTNKLHVLQSQLRPLQSLMKCVEMNWMVMLTGPEASGKTNLVRLLSNLTGNPLEEFMMNNSVDTIELLGGFEQFDLSRHHQIVINELLNLTNEVTKAILLITHIPLSNSDYQPDKVVQTLMQLNHVLFTLKNYFKFNMRLDYSLVDSLLSILEQTISSYGLALTVQWNAIFDKVSSLKTKENEPVSGLFEWVDGIIIKALQNGHWLLIDNANLCNPSVFDRLNSLLEPNGVLMVNEHSMIDGEIRMIRPHKNFRLFMTLNPKNGELSRAMRNRGVEIALLNTELIENRQDMTKLANSYGLWHPYFPVAMENFISEINHISLSNKFQPTLRWYIMVVKMVNERIQRGDNFLRALILSLQRACYCIDNYNFEVYFQDLMKTYEFDKINPSSNMLLHSNCPLIVDGDLYKYESILANVCLQASYLLHIVLKCGHDSKSSNSLLVASECFIEMTSLEDFPIRQYWINFISSAIQSSYLSDSNKQNSLDYAQFLLNKIINHPLAIQLADIKSRIACGIGLDVSYMSYQPLDITRNFPLINSLDVYTSNLCDNLKTGPVYMLWKEYSSKIKEFSLLKHILRDEYVENMACEQAMQQKVSNMTLAQQSYCYHQGRISESQLSNKIIGIIYPFLEKSRQCILSCINKELNVDESSLLFDFINQRRFLWECLQQLSLDIGELFTCTKMLDEITVLLYDKHQEIMRPLRDILSTMAEATALTTGLFMDILWKHFHHISLRNTDLSLLEQELYSTQNELNKYDTNQDDPSEPFNCIMDYWSVIYEMQIISQLQFIAAQEFKSTDVEYSTTLCQISEFRDLMLINSTRKPLDLIPHQRILWIYGNDVNVPKDKAKCQLNNIIQDMLYGWHNKLWNNSFNNIIIGNDMTNSKFSRASLMLFRPHELSHTEGSARLFQSVFSEYYFKFTCKVQSVSIGSFNSALICLENFEKQMGNKLFIKINRMSSDIACLMQHLNQIFIPLGHFFSSESWNEICRNFELILNATRCSPILQANDTIFNSLFALADALKTTQDSFLRLALDQWFIPAVNSISAIFQKEHTYNELLVKIGRSWVFLALGFITLYVPNYPFDPTLKASFICKQLQFKQSQLEVEINVRADVEQHITGESTNNTIKNLKQNLDEVRSLLKRKSVELALRPEVSQINELFRHVHYICNNVIDVTHVLTLLDDLEKGNDLSVLEREILLQEKTLQFIQRINQNYPLYHDLLQPICISIFQLKHGIRLVASSSKSLNLSHDFTIFNVLKCLLSITKLGYPLECIEVLVAPESLKQIKKIIFSAESVVDRWDKYLEYMVVILRCLYCHISKRGHIISKDLEFIQRIFGEIAEIYVAAEDQKNKIAYENECLYKNKTKVHSSITDEQYAETEFRQMFPDFSQDFDDTKDDNMTDDSQSKLSEVVIVKDEIIVKICTLYKIFVSDFNLYRTKGFECCSKVIQQTFWASFSMARDLAALDSRLYPEELDDAFAACKLLGTSILKNWLVGEDEVINTSNSINPGLEMYDFYKDHNIFEAKKLIPVITNLQQRIMELITIWPEHAVLHQINNICEKIKGFNLNSPIVKFLTGLEFLLQKTDDWEAYAGRDTSIKSHQKEIIELIIQWRQLELNCWPKLLAVQDKYYELSASKWWFHLFNCIILPIHDLSKQSYAYDKTTAIFQQHINGIVCTLDQFLQSSKYGDYKSRLELIRSFYEHLCTLDHYSKFNLHDNSSEEIYKSLYEQAADVLWNVYKYYSQFLGELDNALINMRKPIEKDLFQFVKIASWKDINIYALKQSAQKTHRHLSKCIRKYRDVLDKPVTDIIASCQMDSSKSQLGCNSSNAAEYSASDFPENWVSNTNPIDPPATTLELQITLSKEVLPAPDRFINIDKTLKKFRYYCLNDILLCKPFYKKFILDDFATEIISQIKTLQEQTNCITDKDKRNYIKNLKLVKKKSLVDLLKELKRIGLHVFPNAKVIKQQQDLVGYTFQLPRIQITRSLYETVDSLLYKDKHTSKLPTTMHIFIPILQKADDYYYRIIAQMTHLRQIATAHSKDLSLQEVQKGLGFAEDLLCLLIEERKFLCELEKEYIGLSGVMIQLSSIHSAYSSHRLNVKESVKDCGFVSLNSLDVKSVRNIKELIDDIEYLLSHSCLLFDIHKKFSKHEISSEYEEISHNLGNWFEKIFAVRKEFICIFDRIVLYPAYANGRDAIITQDIIKMVKDDIHVINTLHIYVKDLCSRHPDLSHIFQPLCEYITSKNNLFQFSKQDYAQLNLDDGTKLILGQIVYKVNDLLDGILLNIQNLRKLSVQNINSVNSNSEQNINSEQNDIHHQNQEDMCDGYIRYEHERYINFLKKLQLKVILDHFKEIHSQLSELMDDNRFNNDDCKDLISCLLQRIFPFIQQYFMIVNGFMINFVFHNKSLCKLSLVLCNSFVTIFTKGFCMPETEIEDDESGEIDDNAQGTGIGEGDGMKDVSDEIVNEEQVLGTQNQSEQKSSDDLTNPNTENDGIEMENDFEGTMENIEQPYNTDSSKEDDDLSNLDEQVGNFDDDDDQNVDEKMWGDDAPDHDESGKNVDQNHKQSDLKDEMDIVAKENCNDSKQESHQPKQSDEQNMSEADEETSNEQNDNECDGQINNQTNIEFDVPPVENLDLPNNMNIDDFGDEFDDQDDGNLSNEGLDDHDVDNLDNEDDLPSNMDIDVPEPDTIQESFMNDQDDNKSIDSLVTEIMMDEPDGINDMDDMRPENENEIEEQLEKNNYDPLTESNQNIVPINNDQSESIERENNPDESFNKEHPNSEITVDNTYGIDGQSGKMTDVSEERSYKDSRVANKNNNKHDDNPMNDIYPNNNGNDNDLDKNFEFIEDENVAHDLHKNFEFIKDENVAHDLQVMAAATEDQIKTIDTNGDDHQTCNHKPTYEDKEIEEVDEFTSIQNDKSIYDDSTSINKEEISINKEEISINKEEISINKEEISKEILISEQDREHQIDKQKHSYDESEIKTMSKSSSFQEHFPPEDIDSLRQELEIKLSEWRKSDRDITKARELWRKYENLTYDLANNLCEQLRLILEPTLAAKLKGDYRTGKRLNMKKIIPYIASNFRKDKIWLRRTKLSKRQYQVMIAVDDSKSMSETHSIQLAYETLALISKALSQLEVGDISIVSFGERVQLLHPFDQPFSSEAGAQVLHQFTFEQNKTYVRSLMETSIELLERARSKYNGVSQKKGLWQLQLIISDGVCEDHETLKSLVRKATEAQIMVVFIIVDKKSENDSITSMNQVKYKSVNGLMTLSMERYLNTFPFEYYVILRNINALPEILADTLRQYFSIIIMAEESSIAEINKTVKLIIYGRSYQNRKIVYGESSQNRRIIYRESH